MYDNEAEYFALAESSREIDYGQYSDDSDYFDYFEGDE